MQKRPRRTSYKGFVGRRVEVSGNLTVEEVLALHSRLIATSSGSLGVRDANALDSAVAQPQMTFGGTDLYETIARQASALGHSLISKHPFVDGNKRVGRARSL